ncbi:MAG: hypothetical protein ACP5XB_32420, partial [Isosphaeraceae bacterium]
PLHVLYQAANQDPPSPRSINPAIPQSLAKICLKMLSRFPENRYASCEEVARALRRWSHDTRAQRYGADRRHSASAQIA